MKERRGSISSLKVARMIGSRMSDRFSVECGPSELHKVEEVFFWTSDVSKQLSEGIQNGELLLLFRLNNIVVN